MAQIYTLYTPTEPEKPQAKSEEYTPLGRVGRGLGYAAAEGATTFGQLPYKAMGSLLNSLTGNRYETAQNVAREPYWTPQKAFLTPEEQEQIKPKSKPEELAQEIFRRAPVAAGMAALTGGVGTIAPALAGSTLGATVGAGAKAVGAPEWLSTGADIATDIATNFGLTAAKHGLPVLPSTVRKAAAEELGPITKKAGMMAIDPLIEPMNTIKQAFTSTGEGETKDLLKQIYDTVRLNTNPKGNIDLRGALHVRHELDRVWSKVERLGMEEFAMPLRDATNDLLRSDASKIVNPSFWNNLALNDQLTMIKYSNNNLSKLAQKFKPALTDLLLSKKFVGIPKAVMWAALSGASGLESVYKYMRSPAFRKIYIDLASAASTSQYTRYAKNLLDYVASDYKKQPKPKTTAKYQLLQPTA